MLRKYRLSAALLILLACAGCRKTEHAWFHAEKGQTLLYSSVIPPHTDREFDIPSSTPLQLSFETDATLELMEKYDPSPDLPVRLEHRKSIEAVASVKGAGGAIFAPVDGVIPLRLRNKLDVSIEVVVCSDPIKK